MAKFLLVFIFFAVLLVLFVGFLLHVTREFHSVKLICRTLYAIFSYVKKAYTCTANQNGVQLFSHVDV